jgi:hypothetical protein
MTAHQSIMEEVRELHDLNVELMDTLLVIGQRLIEYADKHGIVIEHRDSLALLIGRAQRILALIGTPYGRNPIISEDRRPRDKLTPYLGGVPPPPGHYGAECWALVSKRPCHLEIVQQSKSVVTQSRRFRPHSVGVVNNHVLERETAFRDQGPVYHPCSWHG